MKIMDPELFFLFLFSFWRFGRIWCFLHVEPFSEWLLYWETYWGLFKAEKQNFNVTEHISLGELQKPSCIISICRKSPCSIEM